VPNPSAILLDTKKTFIFSSRIPNVRSDILVRSICGYSNICELSNYWRPYDPWRRNCRLGIRPQRHRMAWSASGDSSASTTAGLRGVIRDPAVSPWNR
jgi:hypothetical protein